jgi:DNA transposition AAA+ family ATPase
VSAQALRKYSNREVDGQGNFVVCAINALGQNQDPHVSAGNLSQKALAERLGVNPSTVTRLLKGQRRSRRLEKQIAEILELAPRESKIDKT